MKTAALLALALAGSLQADPIWSYQFAEQQPDATFIIWHDGPISDMALFAGSQLHSCWPSTTLFYCEAVYFMEIGNDLLVSFSRQPIDIRMDRNPPDHITFLGARLDVPGTYTDTVGGAATLKISNDPADLAPEPATWALLSFGMIGLCASRHRSLVVRRKAKPIAYSPRPSS